VRTTGPEIWAQMGARVDAVVCGVGSGGTITGLTQFFRSKGKPVKMILADPQGSVLAEYTRSGRIGTVGSWQVEGIGEDFVPPIADLSGVSEIFSEVGSVRDRISWSPDDRVVYCSRASGDWDIWIMNKDGSGQRQLTIDPHNDLFPAVSADGRFIFFASDRAGAFNIWRMEIDGSNPTQITRGVKDILPEASPDGRWVIYQQGPGFEMDDIEIWRAPAGGGAPERLTDKHAQRPAVSPDGGLLAYVYMDEKEWGLAVLALDRREVIKKFPFPSNVGSRAFRWTPDGASLAYIVNEKGASNIWLQPLNGERPRQLTNFKSGKLLSFAWSPNGQWSAYMRHRATSDVVLLRDLQ